MITIFLITFLIHTSLSNEIHGLCRLRKEQICTGRYDSFKYIETCEEKSSCNGNFNKQCGKNYCLASRENCQKYFQPFNFFGTIKTRLVSKRTEKLGYCPSDYIFHSKDVCTNGKNCKVNVFHVKQKIHIRCHCPRSHSFECGHHYCTINNRACDALKHLNKSVHFKSCHNGEKVIHENVKIFKF